MPSAIDGALIKNFEKKDLLSAKDGALIIVLLSAIDRALINCLLSVVDDAKFTVKNHYCKNVFLFLVQVVLKLRGCISNYSRVPKWHT